MDGVTIFYAIGIILSSIVAPFFGGHHLNSLYREPDCGFGRMKIDKRFKRLFIFDKHDATILKPAVYAQASVYIYIVLLTITAVVLKVILNDLEMWLAWIGGVIPFGYMIIMMCWTLYVGIKYNICKYFKEKRLKRK